MSDRGLFCCGLFYFIRKLSASLVKYHIPRKNLKIIFLEEKRNEQDKSEQKLCRSYNRKQPNRKQQNREESGENGDSLITSICERKSVLKRPYTADHSMDYGKEQVMVANVDDVFIVSSLNDNYNFNRIARYVSVTLQGNATPVVILTKADLCSQGCDCGWNTDGGTI